MKIEKSKLEILFLTLKDTQLSLQDSRIRDTFLKPLGEEVDKFYNERKVIYEKFCTKNEDGTPDIKEDKYAFTPEVQAELQEELNILLKEEVEVEYKWGVTSEKLKEIIEKTNYAPKVGEVEIIDSIISIL